MTSIVAANAAAVNVDACVAINVGIISVLDGITPAKIKLPPSSPMALDQHNVVPAPMSFNDNGISTVTKTWKG